MKLAIIILKDEDKLENILHQFKKEDLNNLTIINSDFKMTNHNKHNRIYSSIRTFLDYENDESRIILNIVNTKQKTTMKEILKDNLENRQYIFFTVDINDLEGLE